MLVKNHNKAIDEAAEKDKLLKDCQASIGIKTSYIAELESEVSGVFQDFEDAKEVISRYQLQCVGREAELDRTKRETAQVEQRCATISSSLERLADRNSENLEKIQTMEKSRDETAALVKGNHELQWKLQAMEASLARLENAATLSDSTAKSMLVDANRKVSEASAKMEIGQQQKAAVEEASKELEAKLAAYADQQTMDDNIIKGLEGSLLHMKHQKVLWKLAYRGIQSQWAAAQKTHNETAETCNNLRCILDNTEIDVQVLKDTHSRKMSALQRIEEDKRMAAKRDHDKQIEAAKWNISNLLARIGDLEKTKAETTNTKAELASNLMIAERNVREQQKIVEDFKKSIHDDSLAIHKEQAAMKAKNEQIMQIGASLGKKILIRNKRIDELQHLLTVASATETKLKNELKSKDEKLAGEARRTKQIMADQEKAIEELTSQSRLVNEKYEAQCEELEYCNLEIRILKDWHASFREKINHQEHEIASLKEVQKTPKAQKESLNKRFSQFAIKFYDSKAQAAKAERVIKQVENSDKKAAGGSSSTHVAKVAKTSVDEAGYDDDGPSSSTEGPQSLACIASEEQTPKV